MSITVIGTVFVDSKAYPYEKYIPGGRNAGYEVVVHGGVGRNIAEDISRIGAASQLVALTDESGTAKDVAGRLKKSGVDIGFLKSSPNGMGKWIAVFDDTADVAASISIRPNLHPLGELIEKNGDKIFKNSDGVIIEIDVDEDIVEKTVFFAKKYNKPVYAVVSVMSITLERKRFFPDIDCLICNEQEAGMLFEARLEDMNIEEIRACILKNIGRTGLKSIIVTLAERGSVSCLDEKTTYVPACSAKMIVSTGAGDSIAAGALAALTGGCDFQRALEIGSRTAAYVIESEEKVCPDFGYDRFGLNR